MFHANASFRPKPRETYIPSTCASIDYQDFAPKRHVRSRKVGKCWQYSYERIVCRLVELNFQDRSPVLEEHAILLVLLRSCIPIDIRTMRSGDVALTAWERERTIFPVPKPEFPTTDEDKAKVYLHIMVEIKARLEAIGELRALTMPALFVNEACYLQLRYICELIAMGCLVVQGDYQTQRAFTRDYSPPNIFRALRATFPHYFPLSVRLASTPGHRYMTERNDPEAYKEGEITALWKQSGGHLHRASLTKYMKATFAGAPKKLPLDKHLTGLYLLLANHAIHIRSGDDTRLLQVNLDEGDGTVGAHWLEVTPDGKGVTISSFHAQIDDPGQSFEDL